MAMKINPISGELEFTGSGGGGGTGEVDTLTGDSGGAVSSDGADNIDVTGDVTQAFIETTGTPASNLLELKLIKPDVDGQLLIGHTANAEPSVSTLTAGAGITVTNGAGAITISSTATSALAVPTDAGTANALAGSLDILGGTGVSTVGAGNTVTINASAAVPTSFVSDAGTANPAGNSLNVLGGTGLSTSGVGATLTIDLDVPVTVPNGGTGSTSLTDGGVMLGSGSGAVTVLGQATDGQLVIGSTGVDPVLATLTAGSGITVTNAAGAITIGAISGGWVEETTATRALVVNENVVMNRATLITATLPDTAAFGSTIRISGKGVGGFLIAQNAGESIIFGTSTTTVGVGGSLASTQTNDCIELLCTVADATWTVLSSIGNLDVV